MDNSHFTLNEDLWDENHYHIITDHCEVRPVILSVTVGDISTSQTLYVHKCDSNTYHENMTQQQKEIYLRDTPADQIQADKNIYFVND